MNLLLDADGDVALGLVEGDVVFDLLHLRQRRRVVPRGVLDLRLVRGDGVVASVALVRAVG